MTQPSTSGSIRISQPGTARLSQPGVFRPAAGLLRSPQASPDNISPIKPDNISAPPSYGAVAEGPRVEKPDPTALKPSRFSSPHAEAPREPTRWELVAPYICEFVGTFMLVFTAATCDYTGLRQWAPTAVGCVLTVIIYAIGFVSGGHLNPAVSLAVFLARKMPALKFLCYILVQLFAGLLAGFFFELVFMTHSSWVAPVAPFRFTQVAIFEFLFTAMLCFVWLSVSSSLRNNPENDKNQFFGVAIGFVVIAAGYAGANISGAVLNPSLALGLDLSGWWRHGGVKWGFDYALVELLGGVFAAVLFRLCRGEDYMERRLSMDGYYVDNIASYVPPLAVRMFSEFLGTFFIVLTFGLNVIMMTSATAWSVSAALICMVYALANVSGGHFNPAVTAAVVMSGRNKCSTKDGVCYALVQILGGIAASILMCYMHRHGPTAKVEFGLFGLTSSYHWGAIATVEILFTFLLTYVVLAVATSEEYTVSTMRSRQNFYFALAIGLAMGAGCFASGQVSGGYLNPAIAMGFAVEGMPDFSAEASVKGWPKYGDTILKCVSIVGQFLAYFGYWLLYLLFEMTGAALAAGVFRLTHPTEFGKKAPPHVSYAEYMVRDN